MRFHFHRAHASTKLIALGLLVISVFLLQRGLLTAAPMLTGEYPNPPEEVGITLNENFAQPGDTNVKVAEYDIAVEDQAVIYDGANSISEGDALTLLSSDSDIYFVDGNTTYDPDEHLLIRSTNNSALDEDDEVLISIAYDAFLATPTVQGMGYGEASAWLDQDSDSVFDTGEDFVRVAYDAGGVSDGDTIRLFADDEVFAANGLGALSNGYADPFSDGWDWGSLDITSPAFVSDNDGDGIFSAGDTVDIAGGDGTIDPLDGSDGVCFDGSINDDSEFDYTDADNYEVIWWDVDGDCSSFDTGVDVILTGKSAGVDVAPSGTSTLFGAEGEVGWNDPRDDNSEGGDRVTYRCSRTGSGICYEIYYSGIDGTNWSYDSDYTTSMVFFDESTEATDGLVATADAWSEAGFADYSAMIDLSEQYFGGESYLFYVDGNANTSYDSGEAILAGSAEDGDTTLVATGQTVRFFADHDYYFIDLSSGLFPEAGYTADRDWLFRSTNDANIDLGVISDGGWADDLIFTPSQFNSGDYTHSFSADSRSLSFYDSDLDGDYAVGDDIFDGGGVYGEDDLLVFQINVDSSSLDDDVFDAIYITIPTGAECAGVGTDTTVGSILSAPFLGQDIAITADPMVASDNGTSSNRVCVYADIASSAAIGTKLGIQLNSGTIDFSSGTLTGGNVEIEDTSELVLQDYVDVSVSIDPGYISQENDVTFTFTSDYNTHDYMGFYLGYPGTIDITGSTVSCTIDDVSATVNLVGTLVFGPYNVIQFNFTEDSVVAGDEISCVHTGVSAPDAAGVYTGGLFIVHTNVGDDGGSRAYVHSDETQPSFTFIEEPSEEEDGGGGGRGSNPNLDIPVFSPPDYEAIILTPNGGEKLKGGTTYPITWSSDEEVEYVNLAISFDGGESYSDLVRGIPSTGTFSWKVPEKTSTDSALIRIQSLDSDATTVRNTDTSDSPFAIIDVDLPYLGWRSPAEGARLQAGGTQWLLWESSPLITEVDLAISFDGGVTFSTLAERIPNKNAYRATLPKTEADAEKILVRLIGYSDDFDPIEVIAGPMLLLSEVDDSSITVTHPNVISAYRPGDQLEITWKTNGIIPFVELQFAPDGSTWKPITQPIENTGSYVFEIPDIESQYSFVRVGGLSSYGNFISDRSDEPFWIVRPFKPSVNITSPLKGDKFSTGDAMEMLWESTQDISTVNIYYQFADGARKAVALGAKNVNFYNWKIPEIPINSFELFLEGVDNRGSVVADDVGGPFEFLQKDDVADSDGEENASNEEDSGLDESDDESRDDGDSEDDDTSTATTLVPGGDSGSGSAPGTDDPGVVDIAIFDQSGLDIYQASVTPRVSVADGTIQLDPRNDIDAIVGTNLLVELISEEPHEFVFATDDGRQGSFAEGEGGVFYVYVPIGQGTEHIKVKGFGLEPEYNLSLRINPQGRGAVLGLDERNGDEFAVVVQSGSTWDSSATGQVNPIRLSGDNSFAWYVPNGRYVVEIRDGESVIQERLLSVRNNIINPTLELGVIEESVGPLLDFLLPADAEEVLISLRSDPIAQDVAAVATPVGAAAVVASTLVLGSFFNLFNFLQSLLSAPFLLLGRRRRSSSGLVYNSATGAPIPFATIRFYDIHHVIARTIVTNTRGQYSVALPPGKYRPVVVKKGYSFPSESIESVESHVYKEGFIDVTPEKPFIDMHFSVDPVQIAEKVVSLRKMAVLRRVQRFVSFFGFILSLYAVVIEPSWWNVLILILQILIVVVAHSVSKIHFDRRGGVVQDVHGKPVSNVIVRLFESTYDKLIETQRTDSKGRYNFMAKKGSFYVVAEFPNGKTITSDIVDFDNSSELRPVAPQLRFSEG